MKIAARRRLAAGVLATTSAVVAGVLIAPAFAAPNGLSITPSGAFNTATAATLTYRTTDADLNFGGTATFTRIGGGVPFTAPISSNQLPGVSEDREQTGTENFADEGEGLGNDGPADAGVYNVSVTGADNPNPLGVPTAGGGTDTCSSCFTVLRAGPVSVTSVAPTSLRPGQSGNVSVLGNNFEKGTRIDVLFTGGDVDSAINANQAPAATQENGNNTTQGITTRTELKRRFTVAESAIAGARDVRVTNLDGNTALCRSCFFVAGAELQSTNPTAGPNDPTAQPLSITFTGSQVVPDGEPRLEFVGTPGAVSRSELAIPGTNVSYNGNSVTAEYDLANAAPGQYQPVVEGDNGVVNACQASCRFTVLQRDERTPTLTSLDRSSLVGTQKNLAIGETATFTATGTNFSEGATLVFTDGAGLTVTDVDFVSPEQLRITISAGSDATAGDKDVTVRLTDGKTSPVCDNCLTVTSGGAASPSPSASGTASPAPGNGSFAFQRFAGTDRYITAARIATGSYETAETVLLANGQSDDPRTSRNEDHFPDALAGAYLAGFSTGPTLLATETALPAATEQALEDLDAQNVVILGGVNAISAGVEQELKDQGYTVTRKGGDNRYETAAAVATTPPVDYVGEDANGDRTAIVASGEGFADALVAGPLGYAAKFPVLLTARAGLSDQTAEALEALEIDHVLIPGGVNAVSQAAEDDIEALGISTQRFAGENRADTAVKVAAYAYDSLGFDAGHVDLALGLRFPDALAGGPHAGKERAPILLSASVDNIGAATEAFLRNRGSRLTEGHIFGGTTAVSQQAEDQAERAVRGQSTSSPSPSASASSSASATPTASPTCEPDPTPIFGTECPEPSATPTASSTASPSASTTVSPSASASATR